MHPLRVRRGLAYDFDLGVALDGGYYLLAHCIQNYVAACKPCNTPLKHNFFPVEGVRVTGRRAVRDYDSERPLIPFPLGNRGIRPQIVIGFDGVVAVPRYKSGRKYRMGRVAIDFFGLNERDALEKGRSKALVDVWLAVASTNSPDPITRGVAHNALAYLISEAAPHSSCARDFRALIAENRQLAERYVLQAQVVLAAST